MSAPSLSHTSRRGVVWYLHQNRTRTGGSRLFAARSVREGALAVMPEGFEFTESLKGVVSVRRVDPRAASAPQADLALVRAELAGHAHLRGWLVAADAGAIVVLRPLGKTGTDPVLKFTPTAPDGTTYWTSRARRSEICGWLPFFGGRGPLATLTTTFIPILGTERFDERL